MIQTARFLPITRAVDLLRVGATPLTEAEVSRTINVARLVLIAGLVFLHYGAFPGVETSPFDGMNPAEHSWATFANSFVLFFFFSTVPLLSTVSGWLYFSFPDHAAMPSLLSRIRRRISSLYLPLVAWNAFYLWLAMVLLALWPGSPVLAELNVDLLNDGLKQYANAVFALTHHPIGYQFWFVRDLLVTVLISPLLWLALRYAPYVGLAVLGAAWLAGNDLVIFFRTDVAFFFYCGGLLRRSKAPLEVGAKAGMILMATYVLLVGLRAMAPVLVDVTHGRPLLLEAATRAMRLVGVVACWSLCCRLAATPKGRTMAQYGGLSFFLFAIHFPLVVALKHLLWPLLPAQNDFWMVVLYITTVALTVSIGLTLAMVVARFAPGLFAMMNGGRLIPVGTAAEEVAAVQRASPG